MSVHLINGKDSLEAWRNGARALINTNSKSLSNVVTVIERPCVFEADWHRHSPHNFHDQGSRLSDVINTIFPMGLWQRSAARVDFYDAYMQRFNRAKKLRGVRWGTYFQRLVACPPADTNQLERAISKLSTWQQRSTTAFVFHPATPLDSPKLRGGPCWQFGELLWNEDDTLDFTVVYRNHDFYNKVLGNFIGLGQLLAFIAQESGKTPGRLVCHSVHAFFDSSQQILTAAIKG
jgi:hypothetical protein